MHPNLDAELCEKYPNIMAERHLGAMQTAMCWGFDHGDGWFHILNTAMRLVQSHIDITRRRGQEIEQVVFEQVEEMTEIRYGSRLRVLWNKTTSILPSFLQANRPDCRGHGEQATCRFPPPRPTWH